MNRYLAAHHSEGGGRISRLGWASLVANSACRLPDPAEAARPTRRHFRAFPIVCNSDGKWLCFRYYDPAPGALPRGKAPFLQG